MIWRLTYCNKDGVQARLDIIKGSSTPVEVIEGTDTPFVLNYKMDKPDKSGFFMTSSADISIFETASFNIDSLKTSSETEIKVEHYINNILDWSGFVIPDFFSKTIGSPATVEMVASDRLATLKGVTLNDLNQYISMRDLAVACLAHTGLSLPLYTLADFGNDGQTNAFFKALGLSGRLSDTKGRNISCYDILKSILVASNSKLVQQDGAWHIVNKWQHEQGVGNLFSNLTSSTPYSEQTINFSDVHVGGRRSIVPVAAITGVYHEFGGGRSYPDNFDFRDFGLIPEFNFPDWTKGGTFNVAMGSKEIVGYSLDGIMQFGTNTVDNYFFNSNVFNTSNYLQMDGVPVPYTTGQIEVVLDLNATAQTVLQYPISTVATAVKIAVGAVKDGSPTLWLNNNGVFAADNAVIHNLNFEGGWPYDARTRGFNLKGIINNPEGYSIIMRIYGSRDGDEYNRRQIAVHFAKITFRSTQDAPKGTIYKRRQGTNFTKEHEIDTTIFGDYMQKGLDGYFYEYPLDDTSSLYSIAGTLTQPLWTAPNDTEQLPLFQHVTRQKSRMFSLAHNMISARIDVSSFKPLCIFIDCNSERYVVVSATYDFLRSEVEVELEQIASTLLNVRDFIYSYFGDGESGISAVGGVSGGGAGGGGLTPEQVEILSWWKKDPDNPNTIFTEMNAYSKLELSAYGAGDGGGGGSGLVQDVYGSSNLGDLFSDSTLTDTFNAYTINRLHERLQTLEAGGGGGGGGSTVTWGALTNGYRQLTVEGVTYALAQNTHTHLWADITDKPSTFAPSAHTHSASDITSGTFAIARIPTGTTASTVALGNHTHAYNSLTGIPSTFTPSAHTHSASDITSGTFAIGRIPTGTTSSTVALGNHLHTGVYEPSFSKNTAFNKNFGTALGTVAQGNDSRINNGQTAYTWGNHASAGYALNIALTDHVADTVKHITSAERTEWNGAVTDQHTHTNKTQIDGITALHLQILSKLNVDASGNLYATENFYSVGGVSAYGPGIGDDSGIQSAYDVWLSAGNTGTKDDFFAAIVAPAITAVQSYTEAEKLIARTNIGALSASAVNDVTNYNEINI